MKENKRKEKVPIGLSVPPEINRWIEMEVKKNPYCDTRQDFILGTLRRIYREEVEETNVQYEK